jgi:hypothetical protein
MKSISLVTENNVNFFSMVISYKIYHFSRENLASCTIVYVTYEMVKENKNYDLCKFLQSEFMKFFAKMKEEKLDTFKYNTLILCLFFYFMNEVLGARNVKWGFHRPIVVQIKEILYNIGDSKVRKANLWGYLKKT